MSKTIKSKENDFLPNTILRCSVNTTLFGLFIFSKTLYLFGTILSSCNIVLYNVVMFSVLVQKPFKCNASLILFDIISGSVIIQFSLLLYYKDTTIFRNNQIYDKIIRKTFIPYIYRYLYIIILICKVLIIKAL